MSEVDSMPVSEHQRVLRFGDIKQTFTALCADDKCPWKHRGVAVEDTHLKAEEHALASGHDVNIYEECRTTIGATEIGA